MNDASRPPSVPLFDRAMRATAVYAALLFALMFILDFSCLSRVQGANENTMRSLVWAVTTYAARIAVVLATAAWMIGAAAVFCSRRGRIGRALALVIVAVPIAALIVFGGLELLRGPGISAKPYIGRLRQAVVIGVPIALFLATIIGRFILERTEPRFAKRLLFLRGLCIAGVFIAANIDLQWKPHLYPAFHNLLWLAIFVFSALVVLPTIKLRPSRGASPSHLFLAVFLAICAVRGLRTDPLADDPGARRIAYQETQFLRRALRYLAPPIEERTAEVDAAIVARLLEKPALDPALLDRALPDRRKFNVVFISVDALRADRLGRNGYRRALTPNLDRFIANAAYFEEAWTAWPSTLMAFSSLFRGVPATATDVYREFASPGSIPESARQETLAQALARAGRRTEAATTFFNDYWVAPFRIGFETFNDYPRVSELRAETMTEYALRAVDRDRQKPFFLWVHYWDPHDPYDPPGGYPFGDAAADRYDAEVQYADRHIGRFLDGLAARGLSSDTIVCLFADHGEELGEHGRITTHGSALSRLQVHVPLAIRVPGLGASSHAAPASLIDLAPTVLELIGAPPLPGAVGRSLARDILAARAAEDAARAAADRPAIFAELDDEDVLNGRQVAVQEGKKKLVLDLDSRVYSLFDVGTDPLERDERSLAEPDVFLHMKSVLEAWRSVARAAATAGAATAAEAAIADPETRFRSAVEVLKAPLPPSPPWARDLELARKGHVLRDLQGRRVPAAVAAAAAAFAAPEFKADLRRAAVRVAAAADPRDFAAASAASAAAAVKAAVERLRSDQDPAVAAEVAVAAARLGLPANAAEAAPAPADRLPGTPAFAASAAALSDLRRAVAKDGSRGDEAAALITLGALPDYESADLLQDLIRHERWPAALGALLAFAKTEDGIIRVREMARAGTPLGDQLAPEERAFLSGDLGGRAPADLLRDWARAAARPSEPIVLAARGERTEPQKVRVSSEYWARAAAPGQAEWWRYRLSFAGDPKVYRSGHPSTRGLLLRVTLDDPSVAQSPVLLALPPLEISNGMTGLFAVRRPPGLPETVGVRLEIVEEP